MPRLTRSEQRRLDAERLQASLAMQALRAAQTHLARVGGLTAVGARMMIARALRELVRAFPDDKFIRPEERANGRVPDIEAVGPSAGAPAEKCADR